MESGGFRARKWWVRRFVAPALFAALSLAVLTPALAGAATTTDPAQVVTVSNETAGCAQYGIIRWNAVKGASSYTVIFNDAAYGGAEQRVPVGEPFDGDNYDPTYAPLNAPKGTHQLVWAASFYSPPCEPADYSGRMTNARVEYERSGEFIEGTVTGPCEEGDCPPANGVKVTAKGKTTKSDTTDADGGYSIKVKKGKYTVTPSKGDLEFGPKQTKVHVGADSAARANFEVKTQPTYELTALIRNDPLAEIAVVGDPLNYSGTNWDPDGEPITVRHDGKVVKRFKAAATFTGVFKFPTFTSDDCRDVVTFAQGRHKRRVKYSGSAAQVVAYTRGNVTADGERRLKSNDPICEGERAEVTHEATFAALSLGGALAADGDDSIYSGARVVAPWAGIRLQDVISTRIKLAFETGRPVLKLPPSVSLPVEQYDTEGKPDVAHLAAKSYDENLSLTGYNRSDGSLAANAGIDIENSVLYVAGDLVLNGKFTGTGLIGVVGSTTITPSGPWSRESGKVLLSKGPIEISGH